MAAKENKVIKIIYVGPLNYGGTCLQRMDAFKALGHEVYGVDTGLHSSAKQIALVINKINRRLKIRPLDLTGINSQILTLIKLKSPHCLWIDKGLLIHPNTLISAKSILPYIKIISFSPDDMLNPDNQSVQYLNCIPLYDSHITTKSYNVAELKDLGAKEVIFTIKSSCSKTHRPPDFISEEDKKFYGGDVGFIGTYEEQRAKSIEFLALNGMKVKIWGNWPKNRANRLKKLGIEVMGREVIGQEYPKAVSSFTINLNFLRKINRDLQTTRSIEIPACGGFMLAERTSEHLQLFEEGKEADYFDNDNELLEKVKFYMANPHLAELIAKTGNQRCITSGYNYESALNEILHKVELL